MKDLYKVLGLSAAASQAEIKNAYRNLSKHHHPDRHSHVSGTAQWQAANSRMADINEAYDTLVDPLSRSEYDEVCRRVAAAGEARSQPSAPAERPLGPTECLLCNLQKDVQSALQEMNENTTPDAFVVYTALEIKLNKVVESMSLSAKSKLDELHEAFDRWRSAISAAVAHGDFTYFQQRDLFKSVSPSPSEIQAHCAARRRGKRRTVALSALVGAVFSFGVYSISQRQASAAINRYAARQEHGTLAIARQPAVTSAAVPVSPHYPKLPVPLSRGLHLYTSAPAIAPLQIVTRGSDHHYLKVVAARTNAVVLTAFVRAGEQVDLQVPLGVYSVRFASGRDWYGERYLFGPATTFAKTAEDLGFYKNGGYTQGHTLELFLQPNGNLRMHELTADDF
jgi:curved DNA-binding protein CbpA